VVWLVLAMARAMFPSRPIIRRAAAFTLLEMMVASAILAVAIAGIYAAFLRANSLAASSRCITAARYILQRAADQALNLDWSPSQEPKDIPAVLRITTEPNPDDEDGWVPFNFDQKMDYDPDLVRKGDYDWGEVDLLADPRVNQPAIDGFTGETPRLVTGILLRRCCYIEGATTNAKTLVRVTFRLKYSVNGIEQPDQYIAIIRAQNS
jgi:prepilin-type N-terminal cleavage/methylation domain-containing protein